MPRSRASKVCRHCSAAWRRSASRRRCRSSASHARGDVAERGDADVRPRVRQGAGPDLHGEGEPSTRRARCWYGSSEPLSQVRPHDVPVLRGHELVDGLARRSATSQPSISPAARSRPRRPRLRDRDPLEGRRRTRPRSAPRSPARASSARSRSMAAPNTAAAPSAPRPRRPTSPLVPGLAEPQEPPPLPVAKMGTAAKAREPIRGGSARPPVRSFTRRHDGPAGAQLARRPRPASRRAAPDARVVEGAAFRGAPHAAERCAEPPGARPLREPGPRRWAASARAGPDLVRRALARSRAQQPGGAEGDRFQDAVRAAPGPAPPACAPRSPAGTPRSRGGGRPTSPSALALIQRDRPSARTCSSST